MYIITASCWRCVLQPQLRSPCCTDSVCPELALGHTVWKWPNVMYIHALCGGLQVRLWQAKVGLWSSWCGLHGKTCLLCEKFVMRSWVCAYVWNKSNESGHEEASVFTPEAISGKTFRTLTKEKATLASEIDKGKNCWNFLWLEENVLVPVSWERKPEEHPVCFGDCIDSARDRLTTKGILLPMLSSLWTPCPSHRPSSQIGTLNSTTCLLLLPHFVEAMQSPCNGFHPTATCLPMRLLTL